MSEHDDLCTEIANTICDYREGELARPNAEHVDRWVQQFDGNDQIVILREMARILSVTYASRDKVNEFLRGLVVNEKLTNGDPVGFWSACEILNLLGNGESQNEMSTSLQRVVKEQLNIDVSMNSGDRAKRIYVDDGIFSGQQVRGALKSWLKDANPEHGHIDIVAIGLHAGGKWEVEKPQNLGDEFKKRGISRNYWRINEFENRLTYKSSSDVLWPDFDPQSEQVNEWLECRGMTLDHFSQRDGHGIGNLGLFSSHETRSVLERAFLDKGAEICMFGQQNNQMMKPLGYTGFRSVGFGSLFVTHRNCPNNAPLVLWWGDPNGNATLRKWYPLVQRRVPR